MNRRQLLVALGGTVAVAGCSELGIGGDGDSDGDSADDGEVDGGTGDGSDGGDGDGMDDADSGDTATPTDTPTATATPAPTETATATPTGGETVASDAPVRTPTDVESRDWEAIAVQEEIDPLDVPDDVPTAFGWSRVASQNTLTVSYGAVGGGSEPLEEGVVYVLFVVSDGVRDVLVWDTPIEVGAEFTVGPEDSAYPMDVTTLTNLVIAYDDGSDVWIIKSDPDLFD